MLDNLDADILNELFKTYRDMMFKIAMGILHKKSDAEDAVQDAFLWIIDNSSKILEIPCYERGNYFATIIEHRSIDVCRKRNAHPVEDIEEQYELGSNESIEETVLSSVTVDEIKDAMNELSNTDYELLYLYLFKGMSPIEISKLMGISEKNIRVYIQRARKRFAKILHKRGIGYDV